ncbi:MAG: HAD family phosphatase, partial [Nonomuraea sp.]|nr:HAD family phosphatase [Nonomuraea sp.]
MRSEVPQAVLFDMDGTLVDTETLWWSTAVAVAGSLGIHLTEADEPHLIGRTIQDAATYLLTRTPSLSHPTTPPNQRANARRSPAHVDGGQEGPAAEAPQRGT